MIQERIRQLIDILTNGNKRAFATRIGVSPTVIENIVGQRSGKPGAALLEKILCSFENVDALWLITGKGQMFKAGRLEPVDESTISSQVHELTEIIHTQARALLEQQQFINTHFPKDMRDLNFTPPLPILIIKILTSRIRFDIVVGFNIRPQNPTKTQYQTYDQFLFDNPSAREVCDLYFDFFPRQTISANDKRVYAGKILESSKAAGAGMS